MWVDKKEKERMTESGEYHFTGRWKLVKLRKLSFSKSKWIVLYEVLPNWKKERI